uniref:Uncharacterized protein n=1 Tax=Lepeophtheirus salmonis TaxID=72036 RepID=A0A0K2UXW5_LEPSM
MTKKKRKTRKRVETHKGPTNTKYISYKVNRINLVFYIYVYRHGILELYDTDNHFLEV